LDDWFEVDDFPTETAMIERLAEFKKDMELDDLEYRTIKRTTIDEVLDIK